MNKSQAMIYNYLQGHPSATIRIWVSEHGEGDGHAGKILTFLKENEYVKHEGSNKSGVWNILR